MPGFNGTGPRGYGAMSGRGLGPCGGGRARGPGCGRGYGAGYGAGYGRGLGRGAGWFAAGYGQESPVPAEDGAGLEAKAAWLRAELARTEAPLTGQKADPDKP